MVALRQVLQERRETIRPVGGMGDWQAITIRFSGEVLLRDRVTAFKGAMFAAYPGDLVFSKIDVRNGALGIIPDAIPKAVVTTEYPVLIPDPTRLRAGYLGLLLRAGHFRAELLRQASGTSGRKRVTADGFLGIEVPLPGLARQDALVAAYQDAIACAAALEQEAQAVEAAGLRSLQTQLGVVPPAPLPDLTIFVARFRAFEQWSHEAMLRAALGPGARTTPTYPMVELHEVATVSHGLQKCPANRPGTHARPYLRVANVQRGRLVLDEVKTINVPDRDMATFRLEVGDVLFVEGNGSRNELGRVALWNGEIADCVHQNHIIKARVDPARLLPEFAMIWFNTETGRDHFFARARRPVASVPSTQALSAPHQSRYRHCRIRP